MGISKTAFCQLVFYDLRGDLRADHSKLIAVVVGGVA